jgi:hypothetical protein
VAGRCGVHCCLGGEDISDEEALQHAESGLCPYPPEIVQGMLDDTGRERAHISVTMLGGCRRQTWLKRREDWRVYLRQVYPAFRGTLAHALMEMYPDKGAILERRFELPIQLPGGSTFLTGKPDKVSLRHRKIVDFKSKADSKIPIEPDPDHVWQVNCYRYLVKHGYPQRGLVLRNGDRVIREYPEGQPAGIEIDKLEIVYFSMSSVRILPVVTLPEKEVEAYIYKGVQEVIQEKTPTIPEDLNPTRHPLCTTWCPVNEFCVKRMLSGEA